MLYNYKDTFIINSVTSSDINSAENEAIVEVDKLAIKDNFYYEKMVKASVYISLCKLQLEAEGMNDKLKAYENDYKKYMKLAQTGNNSASFGTIALERG